MPVRSLRLTTFNLFWLGTPDDKVPRGADDETLIARVLARLDASVFVFQEVVSLPLLERLLARSAPQRRYTLRDPHGHWLTTGRVRRAVSHLQKTAIAYDSNELSLIEFHSGLHAPWPGPRPPAFARFRHASGFEWIVIGVHLKSGSPEEPPDSRESTVRQSECEALARALCKEQRAILLMGDLNAQRAHPSLRPLIDRLPDWRWPDPIFVPEAPPGERWTAIARRTIVDHALASPAAAARLAGPPAVWAYDLDDTFAPGPDWMRAREGFTVNLDEEVGPIPVENRLRVSDHRPLTVEIAL